MNVLRKAQVFYKNELAGYITETQNGYTFQYDHEFLKKNIPISISLPPIEEPYNSIDKEKQREFLETIKERMSRLKLPE